MNPTTLRLKVIEEIQRLPEEKLSELYDVIHFFRIGIEQTKRSPNTIMRFAGCWEDMSEHDFEAFLTEITERRSNAFSGRNQRETLFT